MYVPFEASLDNLGGSKVISGCPVKPVGVAKGSCCQSLGKVICTSFVMVSLRISGHNKEINGIEWNRFSF
jgi:hypothetical protein